MTLKQAQKKIFPVSRLVWYISDSFCSMQGKMFSVYCRLPLYRSKNPLFHCVGIVIPEKKSSCMWFPRAVTCYNILYSPVYHQSTKKGTQYRLTTIKRPYVVKVSYWHGFKFPNTYQWNKHNLVFRGLESFRESGQSL